MPGKIAQDPILPLPLRYSALRPFTSIRICKCRACAMHCRCALADRTPVRDPP